ncbi:MAG: hypothetical protein JRI22_22675, partial [Deltaproteobacteria bacterium]|nr:hypothetical protein [Deltaproteobacteria bacterium]
HGINSATDNNILQWDGTTGKQVKDGLGLTTTVGDPGSDDNVTSEQGIREALAAYLPLASFIDSLRAHRTLQLVDMTTASVDTAHASVDSSSALSLADSTLWAEYSTYLHVYGNSSPAADEALFVKRFVPANTAADSAYFWIRSNAVTADSSKVYVVVKKISSSTTVAGSKVIDVIALNTWERCSFPLGGLTYDCWEVFVVSTQRLDYWLDFAGVFIK